MSTCFLTTPIGNLKIEGDETGVTSIEFTEQEILNKDVPEILSKAYEEMVIYFTGEPVQFTFNINPKGTAFQQKVWEELLEVPYGKTLSYLELSKRLGDPKAIRAVASANGKNPLCIVIPCHRIIGSDGSLTGYAGGLHRKKFLLELESKNFQQSLF